MRNLTADNLDSIRHWIGNSRDWLSAFLADAARNPQLVAIVAMGSSVRGHVHRRSDFDVLVVHRGSRPSVKAPMEVDVRFASVDQLDELVSKGNEIVCWALMFGFALFDSQNRWERLQVAWSGRIPLPSAGEARSRALATLAKAKEMLEAEDESAVEDLVLAALTQLARERLINARIFPASRPELPDQLRAIHCNDPLATLLESAMFGTPTAGDLLKAAEDQTTTLV
jgi:predicted nucleotidyltransferase